MDRTISSDSPVSLVAFLDGGKTLAACCGDGKLRLWDSGSGAFRKAVEKVPTSAPRTFLIRTNQFATVASEGSVQIWDVKTAALARELPAIMPRASRLAFSDDGSRVATAHMVDRQTGENTIRVRDAAGKDLFSVPAGIGGVSILGFSPGGSAVVGGSYDADMRIWNARNGELARVVEDVPVAMFAMSFSPDGALLATAGVDRTIYLWDAKTWKLERKITGLPEMISAIAFSPDRKRLVTGGYSEVTSSHPVTLIVWDVATAKQLRTMPAPRMVVAALFSPDGRQIASAYGDKSLNVWQAPE